MFKRSARTLKFVSGFVANPVETGSLVPSSRFLAQRMLRTIDWRRARVVVELGPGVGDLTRQILARMHPQATLLAIEVNPAFAAVLARSIRDPRLQIVLASALTVDKQIEAMGLKKADCIVCSLPFANMRPEMRFAILLKSRDALAKQGSLVLFQYRKLLLPMLRDLFPNVRTEYEWRNLPPARVFSCTTGPSQDYRPGYKREYQFTGD
jgi:phospholipid N-methyltransferase